LRGGIRSEISGSARSRLEREDRSVGVIDKSIPTLKEELELAERVVKELGLPWKGSNRGRPPVYDQVKLVAAILVKGMRSFAGLAADLRDADYVMTVDGSDSKPCFPELHHVFQRIPREWLEIALARFDELSAEEFAKFENLDTFVVDGSALSCETLIEREVAMKMRLIRESFHYLALVRTVTNTIRGIKVHSNKIADFIFCHRVQRLSQIQSLTLRRITEMRRKRTSIYR